MTPATIAARHRARTTRRTPAQRPPRRISGPSRPKRDPRAGATAAAGTLRPPLAMRLGTRAMRVGDARVLDRLVRGRAWIALMAIGLMGIVFMQVSLLKLNAGISRAVTAADTFDRQNSSLREEISKLDSGERIQSVAAKLGMVTPAAGDVHYLDGRGANGARAAASITAPKPVTPSAAPAAAASAPAATTTPAAQTTAAPAATTQAPAASAASAGSTPATGGAAPASAGTGQGGTAAAPATSAPANTSPANTAPANTAAANTQNTAPTATGPPAVAGGASAPQGGQG
jgi:cell division protein FtsL